jgi:Cu+-exporting ATPase
MTAVYAGPATGTQELLELNIGGMTCAACANTIERRLNRLEGVDATVNFATERALVSGLTVAEADRAIQAVTKAGYSASVRTDADDAWTERAASVRISSLRRRLAVSALLTVPVCDFTILFALVPHLRFPGWELLCILLTIPVVTWGAWPFHRSTFRNLRHGSLSMDTLVSLGSIVAFGWAIYTMLFDPSLRPGYWLGFGATPTGADSIYLDVAAGMITFQLGGRYFETRARRRAGDVLNAIGSLAAREVRIEDADGALRIVPASALKVGDVFVVLPGERLPADGVVRSGTSSLDTSAMTGEAVPVEVAPGDSVLGGTFNHTGRLAIAARSVGANTRLAQMAAIAEDAQRRKAKVQTFADAVSSVFIPIVLGLAVVVTVIWLLIGVGTGQAIGNGIAVLIIACPCALGLATPDGADGGNRSWRAAGDSRQGTGCAGGQRRHRHGGTRQDRHGDHGRDGDDGFRDRRGGERGRGSSAGRCGRGRIRALDCEGDLDRDRRPCLANPSGHRFSRAPRPRRRGSRRRKTGAHRKSTPGPGGGHRAQPSPCKRRRAFRAGGQHRRCGGRRGGSCCGLRGHG